MTTHHSLTPHSPPGFSPPPTLAMPSPTPNLAAIAGLSDGELLSQLFTLVKQDRELTVALLLHLGEVEARRLHCAKGYSSLFMYCVQRLGCSEDVAFKRVGAARLGRRFPLALELLAQGELHLSALMLVGPHLTNENHRDWLTAARKKTKREVEQLVATRCPKPDVASSMRKLPDRRPALTDQTLLPGTVAAAIVSPCAAAALPEVDRPPRETPSAAGATHGIRVSNRYDDAARMQPLSGSSYRVVFTASEAFKQKLDRARELVSHSVAPGNLSALMERAIDLLIVAEEKRRFAVRASSGRSTRGKQSPQPSASTQRDPDPGVSSTRQEAGAPGEPVAAMAASRKTHMQASPNRKQDRSRSLATEFSRYVPASVRRAVWARDGGQCTFLNDEGNRCTERSFLQIEHNKPHARGGPTTVGNCCLRCAAHNAHQANIAFGTNFMQRAMARSRSKQGAQLLSVAGEP